MPADRPPKPNQQPEKTIRRPRRRTYTAAWLDDLGHLDLRRPRDSEAADRIIQRAEWLGPSDRALVLAVFREGISVTALARAHDACPRTLRRRLAAAVARLNDDRTAFVIAHTTAMPGMPGVSGQPAITGVRARIARALYLHGSTMRALADDLQLSLHTVRAHRQAVDALYEAWKHRAATHATHATQKPTTPDRSWR
jgi:lambda repressor-like predicted transcriptional regulator